jgi:hypothetical protein
MTWRRLWFFGFLPLPWLFVLPARGQDWTGEALRDLASGDENKQSIAWTNLDRRARSLYATIRESEENLGPGEAPREKMELDALVAALEAILERTERDELARPLVKKIASLYYGIVEYEKALEQLIKHIDALDHIDAAKCPRRNPSIWNQDFKSMRDHYPCAELLGTCLGDSDRRERVLERLFALLAQSDATTKRELAAHLVFGALGKSETIKSLEHRIDLENSHDRKDRLQKAIEWARRQE